jgi:hypothetical protein
MDGWFGCILDFKLTVKQPFTYYFQKIFHYP